MADLPSLLIPAGAVALGSVLTLVGLAVTNNQARRREREARYDAFRIKRFEIERETLLELQELLDQHITVFSSLMHEATTSLSEDHEVVGQVRRITTLAHRCLDDDVRQSVLKYAEASLTVLAVSPAQRSNPKDIRKLDAGVGELFGRATESVGKALRRDPLPP